MPDKRVLVSGAGGFIGRWSVPALRARGYEVHVVLSGRTNREVPAEFDGVTLHFTDLLNESAADELLGEVNATHLLHFAWIATPGLYWNSEENYQWVSASERLLRTFHARGGRRVLMAGTCAEYDWTRVEECDELQSPLATDEAVAPHEAAPAASPYVACKIALQKALAEFGHREHLSTAWGRIFFQFGPYEHPDRLVASVIRNLLLDREAPCSHGKQIRSFLHVADVGSAFAAVLDSELEGPVNIGSDERIALADLIDRIGAQIGRPDLLRLGARPAPSQEPSILVPNIHRLRDETGWRPRFTLNEGLSDTIEWWRGHLGSNGRGGAAGSS